MDISRNGHIQNQAIWRRLARAIEKLPSRLEGLHLPPLMANQKLQRFTDGDVIIHNENYR
jgi:hypothetical protein